MCTGIQDAFCAVGHGWKTLKASSPTPSYGNSPWNYLRYRALSVFILMYALHIFLFRCVIPIEFILTDELPTSQWYEWGWSWPISISCMISTHYSRPTFLLVPLLALGDNPKFLGFLEGHLYRLENENFYVWYFLHVHEREPQDISLNERAVSSLLCQKWLEP